MRVTAIRALAFALVPAAALAKPLPTGLEIKDDKTKLVATKQGVSVPLLDAEVKVKKVALGDDGNIAVTYECAAGGGDNEFDIGVAELEARFENLLGMQAHTKKKYADAIPHFATAAEHDPATALYATNLLSAQSLAGKLDDADKTIAIARKSNAPWLAWRLAVDPELKALAGRASTKLADKRGTAKTPLRGVAYSSLGLVASEVVVDMWDGIPDGSAKAMLSIVDVRTGKELLLLPTETTCPMDMEAAMQGNPNPPPADKACAKREAAKAAANRKIADRVLADLGFVVADKQFRDVHHDGGDDVQEFAGPEGTKLWVKDNKWRLVGRDRKSRELAGPEVTYPMSVAFIPNGVVVYNRQGKHVGPCEADGARRGELIPLVAK